MVSENIASRRSTVLALYLNTSTAATPTSLEVGDYILQGLDAESSSQSESIDISSATTAIDTAFVLKPGQKAFTATPTSNYPVYGNVFTITPSASSATHAMSTAMQCWAEIATWRNQSASFWNANIANRTWSITSVSSSTTDTWSATSTIYPANVSTYTLCDGSPRANVRPKTTFMSGTTTLWGSFTTTLTPTFRPQPCSLKPQDCRLLYQDTNIVATDDREILRQCGSLAHGGETPSCLLGGGPVDLIYFPVKRDDSAICGSKTGATSNVPMITGLSEITTLGRTFTSASVYISFKTLFATYDGFWDHVGPTFTDLIVPLHSSDISSHCGGWHSAYGTGMPIDYADLNWPVPASAYKCQDRCSKSYTSSATLIDDALLWPLETVAAPPQCNTIWSDINPILAVPTKIRDMVPEWSTCSFWNDNIANFWFDPPLALQPAKVAASITRLSEPEATPAAPSSLPSSPLAENTHSPSSEVAGDTSQPTPSSPAVSSVPGAIVESSIHSVAVPAGTASGSLAAQSSVVPDRPSLSSNAPGLESVSPGIPPGNPQSVPSFIFDPLSQATAQDEAAPEPTNLDPVIATAAAVSVLMQALSSHEAQQTAAEQLSVPAIVAFTTNSDLAALAVNNGVITLGSSTVAVSEVATTLKVPTSALATNVALSSGDSLLSVSSQQPQLGALVIDGHTLSAGGAAVTVAGQIVTKASSGLFVIGTATATPQTSVETLPPVIVPSSPSRYSGSGGIGANSTGTANNQSATTSAVSTTSSSTGAGDSSESAPSGVPTSDSAGPRSTATQHYMWLLGAVACAQELLGLV